MFKEKLLKSSFIITICGTLLFLILTTISMIIYQGGNSTNNSALRYDFFRNFFSDLGRSSTFLGEPNIVSRILFTAALFLVGLCLMFYFLAVIFLFQDESKFLRWFTLLGSLSGIINAIFYVGIGFTPYDLYLSAHITFVNIAFSSSLAVAVIYTITFFISNKIPNVFAWLYIAFIVLLIGYLIILFGGTSSLDNSLFINVIGQKIIVYVEILLFLVQGIGGLQIVKRNPVMDSSLE